MNVTRIFSRFFLLALLILLAACNKNSDSFLNRKYQDMVARYNVYFNGTQKLQEALEQLEAGHQDNYKQVLDVFPHGTDDDKKALSGQMDEISKKCAKIISDRNKSKWVDDAYLLLGKSYFFKADYFAAIETFQYINSRYKNTDVSYEATLWIIRSYVKLGKTGEAEAIVGLLKDDKKLPASLNPLYNKVAAEVFIIQKKNAAATEKMLLVIEDSKRSQKPRYSYILAQLYALSGKREKAREYFEKVTKGNPPYEMAFNAKMNLARNYDPADKSEVRKTKRFLKGMLKDDKNISYFDQIYYELGVIEKAENNEKQAIEYMELSLQYNQGNSDQKAITYLALADIYFAQPDYSRAQAYYDSTVYMIQPEFENYEKLKAKQEVLTDLIKNLILVHREDSLIKIGELPQAQIDKLVDEAIAKEIEQKEELEKMRKEAESRPQLNTLTPDKLNTNTSSTGSWYFYDQNMVGRGYNDFINTYGNRKNIDNWKYASLAKEGTGDTDTEEDVDTDNSENGGEDGPPKTDSIETSRLKYYKDIPFSKEAKQAAQERIANALLDIGVIYYEQLKDPAEAEKSFMAFLNRFPGNKNEPMALFYMYKISLDQDKKEAAAKYKDTILTKYPESDYSYSLRNEKREGSETETAANKEVIQIYESAYSAYSEKDFGRVLSQKSIHDKTYFGSALQPKFELLGAMAWAGIDSIEKSIEVLTDLTQNYPDTKEAEKAAQILLAYKMRKSEKETQNVGSEKKYSFKPESVHYAILILPGNKANINQIKSKITDFNKEQFSGTSFSIESLILGDDQLVLIKEFKSSKEAIRYLEVFKSDKKFINSLNLPELQLITADGKSVGQMIVNRDIEGITRFYNEYYQ